MREELDEGPFVRWRGVVHHDVVVTHGPGQQGRHGIEPVGGDPLDADGARHESRQEDVAHGEEGKGEGGGVQGTD